MAGQNGNQQPNQQPNQPTGQQGQEPEYVQMTQAQLDAMVQQRLERQQAKLQAEFDQKIQGLGVGSLEDLNSKIEAEREAAAEKERQRLAEMEQKGELEKLLTHERKKAGEAKQAFEKQQREMQAQLDQLKQQARDQQTQNTLLAAATESGAINPMQVAQLVASQVEYDDEGRMHVIDAQGLRRTNGEGQAFTVADLTKEFIEQNPHFAKPAPGRGANGAPGTNGQAPQTPQGLDPTRLNDPEYLIENMDAAIAAAKAGNL